MSAKKLVGCATSSGEYFAQLRTNTDHQDGVKRRERMRSALQVFGDVDEARLCLFLKKVPPQQEVQIASEEVPVETESPMDREVSSCDGFASFIRDSPETDDVAV